MSFDKHATDVRQSREIDVVVVGGGQAGLSLSYYLQSQGVEHVVLERDRPFSSWEGRWQGFQTNTPNWMNTLPMLPPDHYPSGDPEVFATKDEILEYFQACLEVVDPPIRTGSEVRRVVQGGSHRWEIQTDEMVYHAKSVAICNGAMSRPRLPKTSAELGGHISQVHSSEYRHPGQIKTRNVLIVGSGSSGVQICRLLGESGRFDQISLSVSNVLTLPKRILGVQIHRFLHAFGVFDVRSRSLLGRLMYSGLETRGDPIMRPGPRDLSKLFDVRLYGRFAGSAKGDVLFDDGRTLGSDDLTIIWCTGFRGDYDLIDVDHRETVFEPSGAPKHVRGVVDSAPGLFFVGLRYQHTVASHDIYGVGADARHIASKIEESLRHPTLRTEHDSAPYQRR